MYMQQSLVNLTPSTTAISRFLLPQGIQFQRPDDGFSGAGIVEGFQAFLDNVSLCNIYPSWWLKTFPVKAFKLASEGYARSMVALAALVEDAMEEQSSVKNEEDQTFLERFVEQGMDTVDIVAHLASFISAAIDTVSVGQVWSDTLCIFTDVNH